ncbi:MAG: 2,3-bisphosphoglycerate-independent phosphoglycerate mutase [Gammaproteobacteria bacterium]|nr:2,3-bisphosphoglycerate-independent phosphoglycerate mutase [Gammaproteobacteria bacterium]
MSIISAVPNKPVLLVILDGFGTNPSKTNNGVAQANTPNLDDYFSRYPHTTINASGPYVGLPDGQMGNSEVGHLTLGSGSIIRQDVVAINNAIESGEFYQNDALLNSIKNARKQNRPIHLIGLVSDGGVHSHLNHLKSLIKLCIKHQVKPLLHMITDGRDTLPKSALIYVKEIEPLLHEGGGAIASIIGRYYAMDRDKRWERTELAWRALTSSTLTRNTGEAAISAETAIKSAYVAGDSDEFIKPILLPMFDNIQSDDSVIFFNFRKDRPRQLVAALADPNFEGFDRGNYNLPQLTCLMPYDASMPFPFAFTPEKPEVTLAEIISLNGISQFHCAETEKYAHVTYFFNGGYSEPYPGEDQCLIASPQVATYDLKPSMSASEVANAVIKAINKGTYGFIVVNFANGDMVGHTAKKHAVIEAVETLDQEVNRVLCSAETAGYSVIVTADHGNCEELIDPFTGEPNTQHTTYPVPCMIIDNENWQLSSCGGLSNIAPTVLQLMGVKQPENMTATSLLLNKRPGNNVAERQHPRRLKGAA